MESRWILWGAGALAGLVALLLLVGALSPVPVPAEVARLFGDGFIARARAFSRARYLVFLLAQALPLAALAVAVGCGWHRLLAAAVRDWLGPHPLATAAAVGACLVLGLAVLELPAGVARFVLDHQYGLSTQSWGLWISDWLRSTAIGTALGAMLLTGLAAAMQRWPQGWWLAATVGFSVYLVVASLLAPVVIDPLFHTFTPLREPTLVGEVQNLAARAGLPVRDVLEMDASRRTRRVNAYFTGFGRTRRIVLYDTLLQTYDRRHVLLVLAHELGHWRHHHIYAGLAMGVVGSGLLFGLAQRLVNGLSGRTGDPAQLAVVMLFFLLASLAALPVQNAISRAMERQADGYALALTGDRTGLAQLEERLGRDNLADVAPHPLTVLVLFSHPPVPERMAAALNGAR